MDRAASSHVETSFGGPTPHKPEALFQEMPTAMKQVKKALAKLQSQSSWDAGVPPPPQSKQQLGVPFEGMKSPRPPRHFLKLPYELFIVFLGHGVQVRRA